MSTVMEHPGTQPDKTLSGTERSGVSDAGSDKAGEWMHSFAAELFPACRSITGEGLRATLRRIQREIPITIHEVPSGTQVLDWTIPDEWNIRDAWIKNERGERVVDYRDSNLHVVNYSIPVRARLPLAELKLRLHTLPDRPEWIPYRTSYYKRDWGFCLAHHQFEKLKDGEYEVGIDSTVAPGALSYGELALRGETEDEFLISCHCCHPSLANDNLSGMAVAVAAAHSLINSGNSLRRYSYRFLFIPGTIGAITWLARNQARTSQIKHGLVLTCLGDGGNFTYKKSRRGHAPIDSAMEHVLRDEAAAYRLMDFSPYGYDERQYCSPGFNLPVGCFMRSQHGTFPEYHTSADNLDFITPKALGDSLEKLLAIIGLIEEGYEASCPKVEMERKTETVADGTRRFLNLKPFGEPQLGKYELYEAFGGDIMPALWVLNFSDGLHSVGQIATKSGLPFDKVTWAADILVTRGLLKEVEP